MGPPCRALPLHSSKELTTLSQHLKLNDWKGPGASSRAGAASGVRLRGRNRFMAENAWAFPITMTSRRLRLAGAEALGGEPEPENPGWDDPSEHGWREEPSGCRDDGGSGSGLTLSVQPLSYNLRYGDDHGPASAIEPPAVASLPGSGISGHQKQGQELFAQLTCCHA